MSMFRVGDKVWLKDDHPDSHWVVISVGQQSNRVGICFNQDDSTIISVVDSSRLTLIDPLEPYKQAVREVLLSKEFLQAFAAAWGNTPLPRYTIGSVGDLAEVYNLNEIAGQHKSPEVTSIDSIPNGWRELEPDEIPSKGDKFWVEGEWVELLHHGTVEYDYYGEKFIRKIEPPKPAFAVGDRVRVCKPGTVMNGYQGDVSFINNDGTIKVTGALFMQSFHPSELQPVEALK